MTDTRPLHIQSAPPQTLIQMELWGDAAAVDGRMADRFGVALPRPCRAVSIQTLRLLWWEPKVWLVCAPAAERDALLKTLEDVLGDDGAATDVSGAFQRIRIEGASWRELLMIGAVFDAESPAFGPGCVAGTVIHHLPVRLDVIAETTMDAYTPPSYAAALLHHWTQGAARLNAQKT